MDGQVHALERRVEEIAAIVAGFHWTPLARCLPMREVYLRPPEMGPYQAIEWYARWAGPPGGAVVIEVAGYLTADHRHPVGLHLVQILRQDWRTRLRRWLGFPERAAPNPLCHHAVRIA